MTESMLRMATRAGIYKSAGSVADRGVRGLWGWLVDSRDARYYKAMPDEMSLT